MEIKENLSKEQVLILDMICEITYFAHEQSNYDIDIEESVSSILRDIDIETEDYEILQRNGYIDDKCFATVEGKQFVEYLKKNDKEHKFVLFENTNIDFNAIKIGSNQILKKLLDRFN